MWAQTVHIDGVEYAYLFHKRKSLMKLTPYEIPKDKRDRKMFVAALECLLEGGDPDEWIELARRQYEENKDTLKERLV